MPDQIVGDDATNCVVKFDGFLGKCFARIGLHSQSNSLDGAGRRNHVAGFSFYCRIVHLDECRFRTRLNADFVPSICRGKFAAGNALLALQPCYHARRYAFSDFVGEPLDDLQRQGFQESALECCLIIALLSVD